MPIKGLDQALGRIEAQVYEVAHRRAMARVRQVVGVARSRGPVGATRGRQRARALVRVEDKSDGVDRVHVVIQNDARDDRGTPYAFFIRSARVPGAGKKNAWLVLVRRPTLQAVRDLAPETARDPLGRG